MDESVSNIPLCSYPLGPSLSTRTPAPSPDLIPTAFREDLAAPLLVVDDSLDDTDSSTWSAEAHGLVGRKWRTQRGWRDILEMRLSLIGEWVLFILYHLLPSFLQDLIERKQNRTYIHRTSTDSTCPRHPTRSQLTALSPSTSGQTLRTLNGIRGVACLVVFNFHFLYPYTRTITHGFLADANLESHNDNDGNTSENIKNANLHQLPFLCLLHRGRAAVCVFFALSGYVLSYRFLQLIRSRKWEQSQRTLSSLAIRRAIRLYIPPTITMTLVMLAAWLHAFEPGAKLFGSPWTADGEWEPHPHRRETFSQNLSAFAETWWAWSNPFTWDPLYIEYDPHLWTIPIEFRGSMILFLTLLTMARLRVLWRCLLTSWLGMYCMMHGRWDVAVFLGGAVVAELHLIISKHNQGTATSYLPHTRNNNITDNNDNNSNTHSRINSSTILDILNTCTTTTTARYWKPYTSLLLLTSLYLLSFPDSSPETTPGFTTLSNLTPSSLHHAKYLFWHSTGSILFIFSIELLPLIQQIFESSIPQYLGQISYALYLVHGPLQHSLAFAVQTKIWTGMMGLSPPPPQPSGVEGDPGHVLHAQPGNYTTLWCLGLLVNWVFTLTVTIVVADLFWRLVDKSCVSLARRFEGLASIGEGG